MNTREKLELLMLAGLSGDQTQLRQEFSKRMDALERMGREQARNIANQAAEQRWESDQHRMTPQRLFDLLQQKETVLFWCDVLQGFLDNVYEATKERIASCLEEDIRPSMNAARSLPIDYLQDFSQKQLLTDLVSTFAMKAALINARLWRYVEYLAEAAIRRDFAPLSELDYADVEEYYRDEAQMQSMYSRVDGESVRVRTWDLVGTLVIAAFIVVCGVATAAGKAFGSGRVEFWVTFTPIVVAALAIAWANARVAIAKHQCRKEEARVRTRWAHLEPYIQSGVNFSNLLQNVSWTGRAWQVNEDCVQSYLRATMKKHKLPDGQE